MKVLRKLAWSPAFLALALAATPARSDPPTLLTGSSSLSGYHYGSYTSGYMVMSGSLNVSDATFVDYRTVGGSGSGGGAGLGGAIFVNSGSVVTLNNVTFLGNEAIGGNSTTGKVTGGSLNGMLDPGGNGSNGGNGLTPSDNIFLVGDGNGNGLSGGTGWDGGKGSTGTGGTGGIGGTGEDGWNTNPLLINALIAATTASVTAGIQVKEDAGNTVKDAALCTAANLGGPVTSNPPLCGSIGVDGVALGLSITNLVVALDQVAVATGQLAAWQVANNQGSIGIGGDGGDGGTGGIGALGMGGGVGGNGGTAGSGGGNAVDGSGGAGGTGGLGGFGAGGGAGGNGGYSPTSQFVGAAGSGGNGGLFGGAGASGTGYGTSQQSGGSGGAGLGGSIFVRAGGTLIIQGDALFDGGEVIGGKAGYQGVAGSADGSDLFLMTGAIVTLDAGAGHTQTFNGTIMDDSVGSPLSGTYTGTVELPIGAGAVVNINSGLIQFNGGNLYSGNTIVHGGMLEALDGVGLPSGSNLQIDGGVLLTDGSFTRYTGTDAYRVQWTGSGGFASDGGDLDVMLNGGQQLKWASDSFVPTGNALIFGADADSYGDGITVGTVTFENDIDLNGGVRTILVTANSDNTDTATMNGVLSNGGLNIGDDSHTGILILTADNTYGGTTTVNQGSTLVLTGDGSISNSSQVTNNGTLDISGTTAGTSFVTLAGTGTVALGDQTLTLTNASTTYDGTIDGTGGVTVSGGSQSLTGNDSYSGLTTIDPGASLALVDGGSVATSSGVVDNGLFDIQATTNGASITTLSGAGQVFLGGEMLTFTDAGSTFDGVIGGSGGIKITGGSETFTGTNTYTGVTWIGAGDPPGLVLKGTGSIALSSGVVDNSIFDISQTTAGASITTLSGTGDVLLGAERLTLTAANDLFSGVVSGTGGLTVSAGTETLSGLNTYTGTTVVNAGASLILTGSGAIAASAGVNDNGTFDISTTVLGASITTLSGSGTVTLGSRTLTLIAANDQFDGSIGGTGGLTVQNGQETLSGTNGYTGRTIIAAGAELALTGTGSIANSSGVTDDGTFDISATTSGASIITLSGGGDAVLGNQVLTLSNASETFDGVASGTGGLTVAAGTETLTGMNTYTGQTTVSSGARLVLNGTGSVSSSATVDVDGTFDIAGTANGTSIVSLSGGGVVTLGNETLTFSNASTTFGGTIQGTGGIVAAGGTQTFSGTNTYTGPTTIDSGATLALDGSGSIATSSGVADAGTFDISGTSAGAAITTLSGAGTVALGSQTLSLTAANDTFSGSIGGAGALAILAGTETLTGSSNYSGGTTVSNATLRVNGDAALGASTGPVALNNGTLVALAGFSANRATSLTGANTIDTNQQTLTWNGTISGTGSLTINGGGAMTLTGTNSYSGGTNILNHTTVNVCSDANLGDPSGPLTVTDSTLNTTCAFSSNRTINLNGTGNINSNGNNVDLGGTVTLNPGTGPVVLFTGSVHTTGPFVLNAQTGLSVAGTLSGVGSDSTPTTIAGVLSPGNSPGTIVFLAPVVLLSSATTDLDVDGTGTANGAGNYDRIVVQGGGNTLTAGGQLVVRLRGITGSANNNYTPPVGQRFNSIHTDAGIVGSFAGLTEPTSGLAPGTQFDAVYSATDMDLVVTPVSYANLTPIGVTDTANRMSLGAAINSYRLAPGVRMTGDRNPVLTALYSLSASAIGPSMDQIDGTVLGDQMNTALAIDRMFTSATVDHRNGSQGALSVAVGPGGQFVPVNRALSPDATDINDGSPFWATAVGAWANTATDMNAPGYVSNTAGVVFGLDLDRHGSITGGVALGYAQGNVNAKNDASASIQSERIVAYGSIAGSVWRADGEFGFAANQYRSNRQIDMGSFSRTAKGGSDGFAFSGDAAIHYGDGFAMPFLEARYDYVTRSAFDETNAGDLSLIVSDTDIAAPRTLLGLDLDLSEMVGAHNPEISVATRLAWAHDFSNIDGETDAALTGAPLSGFTALSSRVGYDSGIFNLSASAVVDRWTSLFGEYHAEFRTRQIDQFLQLGLRMEW